LPKDDLPDSASWSSPPLVLLRDIHNGVLANYDCKDTVLPQFSLARELVLVAAHRTVMYSSRLAFFYLFYFRSLTGFQKPTMCGERTIPTCPGTIPSQHRVTIQILED
jgi:hypothetical protein